MGRNVKIVDLNFDWFEKTIKGKEWADNWFGFVLDPIPCKACDGKGKNLKGKGCPVCYSEGKTYPIIEPPKSYDENENGYQMWQDVSEGSPISPVFKKAEDLALWMVENDNSVTKGTSYKAWLKMIKEQGSCMSGIMTNEGVDSGMKLYEEKPDEFTEIVEEKINKIKEKN